VTNESMNSWETSLLRMLQSWRDSAGAASARPDLAAECDDCSTDVFLSQLSPFLPWPHWMRHELRERLHALRAEAFVRARDQSIEDSLALADHMTTWELWIFERLQHLSNWERLMFRDMERRERKAERRHLSRAAHPSAMFAAPTPAVALPPLDPESFALILDHWIEDLDAWVPSRADDYGSGCQMCEDFFMVEAAGLPEWTPHGLRHNLATSIAALMSEHYPYDWRTGLDPSPTLLGVSETKLDELAEATERCRIEFEDQLFRDMRAHAPRLIEALETAVPPHLR